MSDPQMSDADAGGAGSEFVDTPDTEVSVQVLVLLSPVRVSVPAWPLTDSVSIELPLKAWPFMLRPVAVTARLSAPGETYDEMRRQQDMADYVDRTLNRLKNNNQ